MMLVIISFVAAGFTSFHIVSQFQSESEWVAKPQASEIPEAGAI
jgi:hypothetical protein